MIIVVFQQNGNLYIKSNMYILHSTNKRELEQDMGKEDSWSKEGRQGARGTKGKWG